MADESTKDLIVESPTPSAPPSVLNPIWHPSKAVTPPKKIVFTNPAIKSLKTKNLFTERKNTENETPKK